MAQVVPPMEDPLADEEPVQVDVRENMQHIPDGLKGSQIDLDGNSVGAAAVTLGDGSVQEPHQLSKESDETVRASGEHAIGQKERNTTPRHREDAGTPDSLDINGQYIEPPIPSTKTKPIGDVGDFQHNATCNGKPLLDVASHVLHEEVLSGGLPAALPTLEPVVPPPAETTANLEAPKTESVHNDVKTEHELDFVEHQLKEVTRPGSPYIQGIKNSATDISTRLVHPERARSNESKRILKDFSWEQNDGLSTIPEVSEGDSRNSRETSNLSMVDKSSSTASLCASVEASKSEMGDSDAPVIHEIRRARNRAIHTDNLSSVDVSTQTMFQTRTGWQKVLAVLLSASFFMTGICSHYALGHYLKNIREIWFEH